MARIEIQKDDAKNAGVVDSTRIRLSVAIGGTYDLSKQPIDMTEEDYKAAVLAQYRGMDIQFKEAGDGLLKARIRSRSSV